MPNFSYHIKLPSGEEEKGVIEAASKFEAAHQLRDKGGFILSVTEGIDKKKGLGFREIKLFGRVKLKEKIVFANNLSTMIGAGLTLSRALSVIERQTKNRKLKEITAAITKSVSQGKPLSDSLAAHPSVFPPLFIAMVRSGEETGNLPQTLNVIAAQLEKSYDIRRKIKGAMMYPGIVFSVIIAIGILMMIYVVPTLSSTFKSFNAELPATTRFVIGTSDFLSQHTFSAILAIVFVISVIVEFFRSRIGKRGLSYFVLHAPVAEKITKQANAALTMRTLASLISSGLGIVKGLEITRDVLQNPYYVEFLTSAEKEVQKGVSLASIFEKDTLLYPTLVGEMIQVGEETGKLGELLNKGAQFYEDEVDAITKNLSTIIEPLIMVFVGIAVGFFALSMIQPLYSLGNFI